MRHELEKYGWDGVHAKLRNTKNISYWQRAEDDKFRHQYATVGPISKIDTIAALFRREILLKYPFDPQLKESSEDADLCLRLISANHKLGVSSSVAYHSHRQEFSAFARQRFGYGLGSARMYAKYGDARIILVPLVSALSRTLRSLPSRRCSYVPYYAADGVITFAGIVAGLSATRQQENHD
jgi:GT2 family glycosyltransferase